jgi:GxxExxY protein
MPPALYVDIDAQHVPEFNEWYNREHLSERLPVPGILSAPRYAAIKGAPQYLACYELESVAVMQTPAFANRLRTPWGQREFCRRCTLMHADEIQINALSERIIGCAFRVLNTLGAGFLEKVYENALAHEMRDAGLSVAQQKGITVYYNGIIVGEYVADLVVEETIVVELKASRTLDPAHTAQCINYLKATGLHLCLLLNFSRPRLEIHRVVYEL